MGVDRLLKKFPNITVEEYTDPFYTLPTAQLFDAVKFLRNELNYNFLLDIVGIDYLEYVECALTVGEKISPRDRVNYRGWLSQVDYLRKEGKLPYQLTT